MPDAELTFDSHFVAKNSVRKISSFAFALPIFGHSQTFPLAIYLKKHASFPQITRSFL